MGPNVDPVGGAPSSRNWWFRPIEEGLDPLSPNTLKKL